MSNSRQVSDLVGITQTRQQKKWAPSMHESLKPLEAYNLLINEGEKGTWIESKVNDSQAV